MKKILLVLLFSILTICSALATTAEELAESNEWHDLLLDDPYGQGFVTDYTKFFACGERDYLKEINYLLENRGPELYRKYPGRYECISRNLGIDIPWLEDNDELAAYLAENDFDRVSIGIAEPYNKQAMSFFGHAFMFLSNDDESVAEGVSLNLFAYIDEYSGGETIIRGLQGNLVGYFDFKSVSRMFENYLINLERMVIDYRLILDRDAIRRILLMVWDLRGAPIDYQFIERNCVNGTLTLLDYAAGNTDMRAAFPGILLPTSMVEIIEHFEMVETRQIYSPVITQLGVEIDRSRLPEFDQRKTAWTAAGWPSGSEHGLPPFIPVPDQVERPLYFDSNNAYVELGSAVNLSGTPQFRFDAEARFLLADEWERIFSTKKLSKITLGRIKLFYQDNSNWGLDRIDLFESTEFPKLLEYHIYPSSRFYVGAHRGFADGNLKPVITIGKGFSVGTDCILLYSLIDADLVIDWIGINFGGEAGLILNGEWGMAGVKGYLPIWGWPDHSKRAPGAAVTAKLRITPNFFLGGDYDILKNSLRIAARVSFSPWG